MKNYEEKNEIINNYSVYNALNLYNEELGQDYLNTGYNPFGENFLITEEFITDALANSRNKKEINEPDFLQKTESEIKNAFSLSLENAISLLEAIKNELDKNISANQRKKLNKILLDLQLYIELIKIYILKLKKEKNKYQLYLNLLAINWQLSEDMAKSFTFEFDLQNSIDKIKKDLTTQTKQENTEIIQQAKEIIENNNKMQNENKNIEENKVLLNDKQKFSSKNVKQTESSTQPKYKEIDLDR